VTVHVLTESGRTIAARGGDRIEINLPENASTAYVWHVSSLPDGVRPVDSGTEPPADPAPGAAGRRIMTFDVDDAASGELRLERRRPWEPAGEPDATFAAVVTTE
jgi:predicted secreted protein